MRKSRKLGLLPRKGAEFAVANCARVRRRAAGRRDVLRRCPLFWVSEYAHDSRNSQVMARRAVLLQGEGGPQLPLASADAAASGGEDELTLALEAALASVPDVQYAFAYGSGVFGQAGYDGT